MYWTPKQMKATAKHNEQRCFELIFKAFDASYTVRGSSFAEDYQRSVRLNGPKKIQWYRIRGLGVKHYDKQGYLTALNLIAKKIQTLERTCRISRLMHLVEQFIDEVISYREMDLPVTRTHVPRRCASRLGQSPSYCISLSQAWLRLSWLKFFGMLY